MSSSTASARTRSDDRLEPFDLLFVGFLIGQQAFYARWTSASGLSRRRRAASWAIRDNLLGVVQGRLAGQGLDPPDARGHARFAHDPEQPDVARAVRVGAAAKLLAERRQGDHPHPVPVFFLEQGRGPALEGLLGRHLFDRRGHVLPDPLVDQGFDPLEGLGVDLGKMGEIKTQPIRRHQGAGLLDMVAQHLAQHRVQDVGGGMVELRGVALVRIDRQGDGVALADGARKHRPCE